MKEMNKKGIRLQEMGTIVIIVAVVAIIIAMGGRILSEIQEEQTANTVAYNATGYGLESLETFGSWLPIIVIVIVAVVVIGVIMFLRGRAEG
jgi:hypothetical protein